MTDTTGLPKLKLIEHGHEMDVGLGYPMSIESDDGSLWIARDGKVSRMEFAREIVRRCNAFEGLVEALKALNHYVHRETLVEIQDLVDAALADAEKP